MTEPAGGPAGVTHRDLDVRGLRMHIAEAGRGPLVLLLHGFPESWYSWRHQLTALAAAGFHAVAPDQRGYGRTGHPAAADAYTILHLTGDVIGLSVAYRPRGSTAPVTAMRSRIGDAFYMVYFQEPGIADAELARDLPATFRKLLFTASGDGPRGPPLVPPGGGLLDGCVDPAVLPGWLTGHDISVFAAEYATAGFTGGLNWYRNLDRNWELTAAWHGAPVTVPALYLAGDRDLVLNFPGAREQLPRMREYIPQLRGTVLLPGCGHWTQQERPAEVSEAMIGFLRDLD